MNLMEEIKHLKGQNVEKDNKMSLLECRVADLEQYYKMNNLIVSGLETTLWSYTKAAAGEGEPT